MSDEELRKVLINILQKVRAGLNVEINKDCEAGADEIMALFTSQLDEAELDGRILARSETYAQVRSIHMAHDWNETSPDLKDWLNKELHDIRRLEAQKASLKDKE